MIAYISMSNVDCMCTCATTTIRAIIVVSVETVINSPFNPSQSLNKKNKESTMVVIIISVHENNNPPSNNRKGGSMGHHNDTVRSPS